MKIKQASGAGFLKQAPGAGLPWKREGVTDSGGRRTKKGIKDRMRTSIWGGDQG